MKYSKFDRDRINKAIHDAAMIGLSTEQTLEYVRDKTDKTIGRTQLVERKRLLRIGGMALWNKYRKDDFAYRLEHLERIKEAKRVVESAAKKMIENEEDPKKFWFWKSAALTFMESIRLLSELHSMIPEIDMIGREGNENADGMDSEVSLSQSAATSQTGRVF